MCAICAPCAAGRGPLIAGLRPAHKICNMDMPSWEIHVVVKNVRVMNGRATLVSVPGTGLALRHGGSDTDILSNTVTSHDINHNVNDSAVRVSYSCTD